MGPSWYWMPDVFESYFAVFGRSTSDYYKLERLDPPYRIYFGKGDFMDLPAGTEALAALFEKLEPGSKNRIEKSIASDFEEGYGGIKKLPRSARFGVYVAYVYYSALFKKIRRLHSSQVLRSRVRVPNRNKLAILGYSFVKHQLNLI